MDETRKVKTIQDAVMEATAHPGETVEVELDRPGSPESQVARLAMFLLEHGVLGEGELPADAAIRLLGERLG